MYLLWPVAAWTSDAETSPDFCTRFKGCCPLLPSLKKTMLVRKQSATRFLWTSYIISYRKVFNLPRWLLLRWKDVQISRPRIINLEPWGMKPFKFSGTLVLFRKTAMTWLSILHTWPHNFHFMMMHMHYRTSTKSACETISSFFLLSCVSKIHRYPQHLPVLIHLPRIIDIATVFRPSYLFWGSIPSTNSELYG